MKPKRILAFILSLVMVLSILPTNIVFADIDPSIFAGGSGDESDPYQIATLAQLEEFRDSVNNGNDYEGVCIQLTADIDMSGTYGDGKQGWTPIGTEVYPNEYPFKGTFDGNGHEIKNLYMSGIATNQGLFGLIDSATIKNLGVSGSANTNAIHFGGICGYAQNSSIIENCRSDVTVENKDSGGKTGGLVGTLMTKSEIRFCFNTGKLSTNGKYAWVGGIVGQIQGVSTVRDSYNTGDIVATGSGTGLFVGGVIGYLYTGSSRNCYNTGTITAENATKSVGGAVGIDEYNTAFYYLEGCAGTNTTFTIGTGGKKTAAEFKQQSTFSGWDFDTVWIMGDERPYLRSNSEPGTSLNPYTISNLTELEAFRDAVNNGNDYKGKFVKLTADIDMSSTYGEGKASWTPIGNSDKKFKGTFDGSGFTIKNLYCTTPGYTGTSSGFYYGLFGFLSDGAIKNLSVSGTVIGQNCAGGVVGHAGNSDIINCYNYCTVTSNKTYVGGIVGDLTGGGSVKNCGNNGAVTGYSYVSSIIGECSTGNTATTVATVENCYNTAKITFTQNYGKTGGIVGGVGGSGTTEFKNCYNIGAVVGENNGTDMGICGIITQGTKNPTSTNCYFLDTCAYKDYYGTKKTADQFASGEVAWLLQDGQTTTEEGESIPQVWGQNLGTDSYPVLTSEQTKLVHKVTFSTTENSEYAVKYINDGKTLGDNFPDDPDDNCEYWWSETADVNGTKFTKDTTVTKDMTVHGVKKEKTEASDESDKITLNKNTEITTIDLNDYVKNKSGNEKNFAFALAEGQTLPAGLIFDESTGKITGTPAKVGTYTVKFNVTNNGISLMSLETVNNVDVLTLNIDVDLEGEGVVTNPYLINDLAELEYFRDKVNSGTDYKGKYVKLMDNIDMTGFYGASVNGAAKSWKPIGTDKFNGTFDGNGKEIQNIYVNVRNGIYIGLFGNTGTEAMIKNLGVTGSVIGEEEVGGIVGGDNGTIEHCYYKGTVSGKRYVGGIVGSKCVGDIINCYCTGEIRGTEYVGGVTGSNSDTVKNCYSVAEVSGSTYIGGAIGKNGSTYKEVSNCYYLDGSVKNGTDSKIGTAKTEADFNSGEVAWCLQNGQTDQTVQVWGQKLGDPTETDAEVADKYPVLTSNSAAKVYPIKVIMSIPWSNKPSDRVYKQRGTIYGNIGREITLEAPDTDMVDKPGRFCEWTDNTLLNPLGTKYRVRNIENEAIYAKWNELTFDISGEKQTYQTGTARTITLTPKINGKEDDRVTKDDFDVKYYLVNENQNELYETTPEDKAISAGKYLYVISFKDSTKADDYCYFKNAYTVSDTTLPDIESYDNIGVMLITSGAETAQKPIYFKEGTVNLKVGGTFENELTNENGTTPEIKSSNESVATVELVGGKVKVTAIGKGTATITATSTRENTTPVYASFTVNVTRDVITVTANNNTIKYGTDFANVTDNTYTVSKEGVTLSGTPIYTTDYEVGDGVGKYEINVSGLTSNLYDIEYKSGKLTVGAKELQKSDFEVTVKDKTYDGSTKAEVTAKVKDSSLVSGDVVTVLVSGAFTYATVGDAADVMYNITGLSGKDSANYTVKGSIAGSKTASISKAKVTVSVPSYTSYVYDGDGKSISIFAYADGIYFDKFKVTYNGETTLPTNVGTYNVGITLTDDNYDLDGAINATLEIKSAQQDVFSIEGISDSVTYGDVLTLQTAGAIAGGSVSYEITSGGEFVTLSGNEITTKGVGTVTVKATSTKANYADKTATRTFVIKPKTISVTAEANERAYDGTKDVDVLLSLNGVLSGDSVKINGIEKNSDGKYEKTATVATADVENNKTVFVNGLSIDNDNYVLAQTSVQTTVDITKKAITAIAMTAYSKSYDGTKDATYKITKLDGVIDADKDFVTVTGNAEFNYQDVAFANEVTLSGLVLSGAKSGNYELTVTEAKAEAHITKAKVDLEFGTLSFVYDGKPKYTQVTATANGMPFEGIAVGYGEKNEISVTNAGKYDIKVELAVGRTENYELNYPQKKQLEIVKADQSTIMITGLPGTIDCGKEFTLAAVGGSSELAPKWSTSNENIATVDESTGAVKIVKADGVTPVTITVTKSDNDSNHTTQSASVTFTPVKKTATFRITGLSHTYDGNPKAATVVTNATDSYDIKYTTENGEETTPTDAGTYYVEVVAKDNYEGEQIAVMTIRKGTLDTKNITISIPENLVYGNSYSVTTNYNGGTITYSGTGINGKPTTPPTNAGSYTATLTIDDPNYETVTVEKPFEIAKRKLDVKIKGENGTETVTRAYGEANPVFELDYSGFANDETKAVLLIEPTASTTANSSSNVGNYPISVTGGYDENYYFDCSTNGKLEVTAATTGNFRVVVASGSADAYIGNKFTLGAYYNNEIQTDVDWISSNPDIVTVDNKGNVEIKGMSETVTITAAAGKTSNCKGMTATYTITPQKKHISLSASAKELVKVYNGEEQYINFTAPSGVDLANITVNTTYVMTTNPSKDKPTDVGTYMVSYEIDDDCYEGSGNFTLTINKATVTVKVKDDTKVYGDEYTGYDIEITNNGGITNETALAEVIANIKSATSFASDGAAKTAVVKEGGYEMILTLSATETDNVKFTVDKGTLTVNKAPLTIKVKDVSREYGAENPALEAEYTGFKNDETKDVLSGELVLDYDEGINAETAVGTYEDMTTASGVTADNYEITFEQGDVEITKIAVNASAGTSRASYLTVVFDKAVEGVTFTVKDGETPVEITSVTASDDNKTYTLNGTFAVGTEYTVEIAYASETQDISNKTLKITPAKQSSGGGGGGGGGSFATTSYTVTFETNGGSKIDSVKVEKNKTLTEPTAPTKDGFEFDGWYSDKKLTTAYDFDAKVTKAVTLYAKWTEKKPDDNKDDNNNPTPSEWKNPFTDVTKADWYFDNVKYANENGLMSGTTDTTFAPNETLTRGMLVTVLYRAEGEPAVNKSIPFADVNASQYYADAVIWAQQNDIVKGVSETEFAPDENITREQIATIIYRYAEYKGIAPTGAWAIKLDYADAADISDYAVEGVMYCTMKGIMQGKDNNMFAPKDNATRAEIAAILQRFIEGNK